MNKASVARVLARLDSKPPCPVKVVTRWGTEYLGNLVFSDRFMNIELEQATEMVKGVKIRVLSHIMLHPEEMVSLRTSSNS